MTDTATRDAGLRQMLGERRRALQHDVQSRIRNGRSGRLIDGQDDLEQCDADIQDEIEFALLQMRAETMTRIEQALAQLDAGHYGYCTDCAGEISERRLTALPFAVRCQSCEQGREREQGRGRRHALSLFPDMVSS